MWLLQFVLGCILQFVLGCILCRSAAAKVTVAVLPSWWPVGASVHAGSTGRGGVDCLFCTWDMGVQLDAVFFGGGGKMLGAEGE